EDVLQVAGIGSGDQHGVDFGAAAEFFGGSKGKAVRDAVLPGRLASFVRIPARQRNHLAIPSQREARHQTSDSMQSESRDAKANHLKSHRFRLRVWIKDEKQQRQGGQPPERRANIAQASRNQLAKRIQDEARRHANPHIVSESHQDDDAEGWNQFGEVVEGNASDRSEHQQSNEDERGSVSLRRNGGDEGREKQSSGKTHCRDDRGQAGSATGLYSGSGLDIGAGGGSSNRGGEGCGERVGHHRPLDLRQVAVFVEEPGARRHTDQRAHRVHKSHDKNRQHDREESPGEQTVQIELKENGLKAGRTADPTCGRRSDPGDEAEQGGGENSAKNRGRKPANGQHRHQQETKDGEKNRKRSEMARSHRRSGRTNGDDAGLIQADEGEKQSDADSVTVTEGGGNGVDHPLAKAEQSHQNKKNSGQEHRAQSALPRVSEHVDRRERDKSVLAHIRTDGKRTVGIKAHQQRSENGRENGGCERSTRRHSGRFQDGRVDGHDVGHREKGSEAGDDFAADGRLVVSEFKEPIEPELQIALGRDSGLYIRGARRTKRT